MNLSDIGLAWIWARRRTRARTDFGRLWSPNSASLEHACGPEPIVWRRGRPDDPWLDEPPDADLAAALASAAEETGEPF